MGRLLDTLVRLGAAELGAMLGPETVKVLELMGSQGVSKARLAELVVRQRGGTTLLLDRGARTRIVEALPAEDARVLATILGAARPDDPFNAVVRLSFTPRSPATDKLLRFFGCDPDDLEPAVPLPITDTVVDASYGLFDHQAQACRDVLAVLRAEVEPRVFLHMPTGSGKTRVAMSVISEFMRGRTDPEEVVVWLAYSQELCDQAAEELASAWHALGTAPRRLMRFYGPHRIDLDSARGGFLVAGLQLLYQRSLATQQSFFSLARRVPLVVMDEAHQATAPTYRHLLDLLATNPRTGVLGLSATPGRNTIDANADVELADYFARRKVTLHCPGYDSPVSYLQDHGFLAKVEYRRISSVYSKEFELAPEDERRIASSLDVPEDVLSKLGRDHQRNLLILTMLMREADEGRKIIVFACSVEHARLLASILAAKGYRAAEITGGTPAEKRRRDIARFRETDELQVLANYGVLTTGFDAPRTNTAFIARPTKSVVLYSQMIGRAIRGPRAGGNETCRVITVVDKLPGFRDVSEGFEYWEDIWA